MTADSPIVFLKADPNRVTSPARFIWDQVPVPIRKLNHALVLRLVDGGLRCSIGLIQQRRFQLGVAPASGELRISTGALVLLWACSFLNLTYWRVRTREGPLGKRVDIDPNKKPRLKRAMILLGWALNHAFSARGEEEWPVGFPHPTSRYLRGSVEFDATQMTLRALGFILLHEFAHLVLKHEATVPSAISIDQEKDADREAVAWYFEGSRGKESSEFKARSSGVVAALYFASVTGFFDGEWGSSTHPPGWMRIEHVLGSLSLRDYHPTMVLASELKSLYLSFSGATTGGVFETPSEAMEDLYEFCSRGGIVPPV